MKRLRRNPDENDPETNPDPDEESSISKDQAERKYGLSSMRSMGFVVVALMVVSVVFSVSVVLQDPPSDGVLESSKDVSFFDVLESNKEEQVLEVKPQKVPIDDYARSVEVHKDKLLGGLLAAGFDETSCASRDQSALYRKESLHKPSPYLISRLRSYEALHKRCGTYTESYNKTLEKLKNGKQLESTDCNYLVWISFSGLGNRILTLASAFLYALLTNRVLLVDPGTDMVDLFCEPFPDVSWFLPPDFPLVSQFSSFDQKSPHCYGRMVKNSTFANPSPYFLYLHLVHDYDDQDKLFFCQEDQNSFLEVQWLIMKTDNYFVPSLFLIPSFEQELSNLFPRKDTVFHFLGRYLFHPTEPVWGLITRYYQAYLAKADERIGIQIRVFDTGTGPFQHVLDQITACALKENLLPEISTEKPITNQSQKSKAVLVTSLSAGYFERLRDMYWEHPTVTGEIVGFYQPSHEEYQQTEKRFHNRKAWAEMYLLSLTDVLISSSWSTFGYVAQGLGGLKPWILYKPENGTAPDPPCRRVMSMEPCFHAPPFYDCKAKRGIDTGKPTLFHGDRSNIEEVIGKFAQLTPQERAKRKLESLEALKKTFMKLDHDLNIQDFLGATSQSVEEMTNEISKFRAQIAEVHKRLSYWSNPDKIDNIEHLRQMEDSLRESIERVRIQKEIFGKHHLMSLECTNQFQNRTSLPVMIGGVQEAQPVVWLPNNESQHMLLHNEPNFLPHREAECSTDCSLTGYSDFFGAGKQIEISSSGQVDNVVRECNALNELGSNACINLEPGEQYFYPSYRASNFQDERLKNDMEMNLQGNHAVNQVISNFEIPRPVYNNGHQAWASSSGPCGIAMFDGNSYHQTPPSGQCHDL